MNGTPARMPQDGKPARIEHFQLDGSSKLAGEVWAEPAAAAREIYRDYSLLYRLGSAGMELFRGIGDVGKIIVRREVGEVLADALRKF